MGNLHSCNPFFFKMTKRLSLLVVIPLSPWPNPIGPSPLFCAPFFRTPSQMFHPNIYNNGEICLDILQVHPIPPFFRCGVCWESRLHDLSRWSLQVSAVGFDRFRWHAMIAAAFWSFRKEGFDTGPNRCWKTVAPDGRGEKQWDTIRKI